MTDRSLTRWILVPMAVASLTAIADTSFAAGPLEKPEELVGLAATVTEQVSFDNNLYRLPDWMDPTTIFGPNAKRDDYLNVLSFRLAGRWPKGRQDLYVDAHIDDNRFRTATELNHVEGAGVARWDWTIRDSTGQVGVNYQRFFPGFANYRLPSLNLVTKEQGFATGNFRLGPTWSINAAARRDRTFESLDVLKINENSDNQGSLGLQLDTKVGNQYGFDYSYTRAKFPFPTLILGVPFDKDYYSSLAAGRMTYHATTTLTLQGDFGYLKREYTAASASQDFSGDIWHASIIWQPAEQWTITLLGARELTAYVDAESQYFISNRGGATFDWQMTRKVDLRLDAVREKRRYVADPTNLTIGFLRDDTQDTGTLTLVLAPTRNFVITAGYRYDKRDSNYVSLGYVDSTARLAFLYQFRGGG